MSSIGQIVPSESSGEDQLELQTVSGPLEVSQLEKALVASRAMNAAVQTAMIAHANRDIHMVIEKQSRWPVINDAIPLLYAGNPEDGAKAVRLLTDRFEEVEECLGHLFTDTSDFSVIHQALKHSSRDFVQKLLCFLAGRLSKNGLSAETVELLKSMVPQPKLKIEMRRMIIDFIDRTYKLSGHLFVIKWVLGSNGGPGIINHVHGLIELEKLAPGAALFLSQPPRNLYCFGWYTPEILAEQYEARDNRSSPYGVMVTARCDSREAFATDVQALKDLHGQLQQKKCLLRCIEVETADEIEKGITGSHQRYFEPEPNDAQAGHRISFLVLRGHGENDGIELSDSLSGGFQMLCKDDIRALASGAWKQAMESHARCIMDVCSAGEKDDGLALAASEAFASVVAPIAKTTVLSYKITENEEGIHIDADYAWRVPKRVFTRAS